MLLHTFIPPAPLSSFVDMFWFYEGYSPPHTMELTLPDGSMEIVINLSEDNIKLFDRHNREQTLGTALVSGPHKEYFTIDTTNKSTLIGIHFKPGGAFPFLKLSPYELCNIHITLDMLWGTLVNDLRDELQQFDTPDGKFRILEKHLLAQATKPLVRHRAVSFALKKLQSFPYSRLITDITEEIGMSQRRFIELFKEEVGMTPKSFYRIQRFQEALRIIHKGKKIEWADVAFCCGYYDQSHFIKDFLMYSGHKPSKFQTISCRHNNHVPIQF